MQEYNSFFLFDDLTDKQIKSILSGFDQAREFSKNDIIYSSEHYSDAIGYIIDGSAFASTDNDNGVVMRRFSAGMCFGAAAVFGNENPYVSKIIAESRCKIQFVTEKQLREIFKAYPQAAINYISFLSSRVRFLNGKLKILSCDSAQESLLKYLISSSNEDNILVIPKNMTMLAKMLGISRASLYRSFDGLESAGLISREKNIIRVKNYEKNS